MSSRAGRAPDQLLPRLAANEEILHRVFDQLTEAVTADRRVTPASEWLLDNFYLIEEQIRTAKRHLPTELQPGAPAPGARILGRLPARL